MRHDLSELSGSQSKARGGIRRGSEKGTENVGMVHEDVGRLVGTACADAEWIGHVLQQRQRGTVEKMKRRTTEQCLEGLEGNSAVFGVLWIVKRGAGDLLFK